VKILFEYTAWEIVSRAELSLFAVSLNQFYVSGEITALEIGNRETSKT